MEGAQIGNKLVTAMITAKITTPVGSNTIPKTCLCVHCSFKVPSCKTTGHLLILRSYLRLR